ncbi:hypothetical protein B0H14DRAFT_3779701 [Mycena olivaceomarginata]|nr:hypothetical protein B0H14DRAFT_3779701 [Mycena olivaceomarginata]
MSQHVPPLEPPPSYTANEAQYVSPYVYSRQSSTLVLPRLPTPARQVDLAKSFGHLETDLEFLTSEENLSDVSEGLPVLSENGDLSGKVHDEDDTDRGNQFRRNLRVSPDSFDALDSDAAQRAASVALVFITQPLPDHILSLPNISQLFAARRELYTVTRQRARRTTLPSSRSSPSPPSPSDSDDEDRVAVSDGGDLDSREDTNDGIAVPETPELALQQPLPALRFYNGDGHILPCVAAAVFRTPSPVLGNIHQCDSPQVLRSPSAEVGNRSSSLTLFDDDDDMELQYPPTLELNFPVAVFIWINESKQPIYQLFAPRGRDVGESECIRGKLVLGDYQTALEAAGLPIGCILQRYIDPTGDWIEFDWDKLIELYLSNRALYLRLYGLDITPPDHILELFTLN